MNPLEESALERVSSIIEKALMGAGVSAAAAAFVAEAIPSLVHLAEDLIEKKDLAALEDAGDVAADAAEKAKFGP